MIDKNGRVTKLRRSINEVGHAHELTFCCYQRYAFLSKDRTRRWFIESIAKARIQHNLELWAYVVMPDHAHVLFFPQDPDYDMSSILKTIKQGVSRKAVSFMRIYSPKWLERIKVMRPNGRAEHRFWQQGGGYDRNIRKAETAWSSVHYIHDNPVRRGLVSSPLDWPWSSAGWYAGQQDVKLAMDACPPDPVP